MRINHGSGILTKQPDRIVVDDEKPEYGAIPKEAELHTLASLCAIINMHGSPILDEPDTIATLLNELSQGDYDRERNALLIALKDNIPRELSKAQQGVHGVRTPSHLKKELKDNHGMSDELADWVIETWVMALEMEL